MSVKKRQERYLCSTSDNATMLNIISDKPKTATQSTVYSHIVHGDWDVKFNWISKTAVEVPPGNRISSRRNDTQRAGNPANHRSPDGTPTICYTTDPNGDAGNPCCQWRISMDILYVEWCPIHYVDMFQSLNPTSCQLFPAPGRNTLQWDRSPRNL